MLIRPTFDPLAYHAGEALGTPASGTLTNCTGLPIGTGLSGLGAVGDLLYATSTTALAVLADVAVGSYLRSGGVTTAPLWSTLKLPNAATAYRLPVATSANTIGEVAAVGATGEYLKGNTGAIPSWATLNQAAVAGLATTDGPTFAHLHITDLAAITTAAESWMGPSSTAGAYFKSSNLGIGTTTPNARMHATGTVTAAANAHNKGISFDGTLVEPTAGYYAAAINMLPTFGSGSSNMSSAFGVYIGGPTKGTSGTITDFAAIYIDTNTMAATNSYGLYVIAPAGGVSKNLAAYFGGNVGINDTAPAEKLDVTGNINVTGVYKVGDVSGVSSVLTLDDGANWRITMTFTGGILTAKTTAASSGATATWS